MDKDQIIQMIRKNKPSLQPLPEGFSKPEDKTDLCKIFCENLKLVGAEVIRIGDEALVSSIISLHFPDAVDFSQPETCKEYQSTNSTDKFEKLNTIVLSGQFGVAENAAIWLDETNFPHRIVPFIAQNLVIKLYRKTLVGGMDEAYRKIDITKTGFGVFISGPSKTADIEQVLVFGAHGPLKHTVLLID
jgi:L-lactate dehydrogenase complex protein LldG